MNESITMKFALGVFSYMMIQDIEPTVDKYVFSDFKDENSVSAPQLDYNNNIVFRSVISSEENAAEILKNFITSIVNDSKSIDYRISDYVSDNLWELI